MVNFTLWILTQDKELANRWHRLFSREALRVQVLHTLSDLEKAARAAKGIVLAEKGVHGLKTAKDLTGFTSGHSNVSIIIFSKRDKINNAQISEFLDAGADDFITPEMDERILFSKMRAHLRRLLPSLNCARTLVCSKNGDIELDRVKRTIKTGLNSKVPKSLDALTPKEFEIFSLLLCNEDLPISRSLLMEEIWKEKSGKVNVETIDKHVETLRNKLGTYGKCIKTVYGTGYTYSCELLRVQRVRQA